MISVFIFFHKDAGRKQGSTKLAGTAESDVPPEVDDSEKNSDYGKCLFILDLT